MTTPPSSDAPFGAALRTAVRGRGLTLDRIRWHLASRGVQIGLSSLSDWQHGRSVPASANSLRAVRDLEDILDLQPGALSHLIAVSRHAATAAERLDESGSPVGRLLSAVTDTSGEFDMLTRRCHVTIDRHRRASVMRDHTAIRARRDGLDRYILRFIGDPGCRIDEVRFGRLDNCRLGRVVAHPEEPAFVAELLFDRPLRAGETWMFATELIDETGESCIDFSHGFCQSVNQFALQVQFDAAANPIRPYSFAKDGLETGQRRLQDLRLNAHRAVHLVASDVSSGVLGIGWTWDDYGS
jgi:hypothetical protein